MGNTLNCNGSWVFVAMLAWCGLTTYPGVAGAAEHGLAKIGLLSTGPAGPSLVRGGFTEGLRENGYEEGRDYVIEARYAEGKLQRLPMLAAELVAQKVDVIILGSIPAALAAQKATKSIPIVVAAAGDFVGNGLVVSLDHPGGNITGLDEVVPGLAAKRLQILNEAVPLRSPVAILSSATGPTHEAQLRDAETAAASLGVRLITFRISQASEIDGAFEEMARQKTSGLVVFSGVLTLLERKRIAELASRNRLPAMHWSEAYISAGGLMYYGPNLTAMFRRSATLVAKILKGAAPATIPVEYPRQFELIVNVKAAKEIGTPLSTSVVDRADRVIGRE